MSARADVRRGVIRPDTTRHPYLWWQHVNDVAVPNRVWTPLPWNVLRSDPYAMSPNLHAATTTVTAGSNGAVLPQATINVASTAAFPSAGYLVITGPFGVGKDSVVKYTGKTATTFTGANSTFSVGTLATGQVVTAANVEFDWSTKGYLFASVLELAYERTATTARWGMRVSQNVNPFGFLPGAITHHGGLDIDPVATPEDPLQHGQVAIQPGVADSLSLIRIEVYQNSGSTKLSKVDGLAAPSFMQAFISSI